MSSPYRLLLRRSFASSHNNPPFYLLGRIGDKASAQEAISNTVTNKLIKPPSMVIDAISIEFIVIKGRSPLKKALRSIPATR